MWDTWCRFFQVVYPPEIMSQLSQVTFSDQSAITAHYDTANAPSNTIPEHPDAKWPCDVCGRKFTTQSGMRWHIRTVHAVGDVKTFRCNVCSRVFKRKDHLRAHMSSVHGFGDVKTFQCDLCSYVTNLKSCLNKHVKNAHHQ